jgi:homopolymeric O-antigen transport system ATP-binding protein
VTRDTLIDARNLSKHFILRHNRSPELKVRVLSMVHRKHREHFEEFKALRGLTLTVRAGEAIGLVGRNGSGKSTLLRMVAGLIRPTSGQLLIARRARIGTMVDIGAGFHPELTGLDNARLTAALHGFSRKEIDALLPGIIEYSGLEHFIDQPLKNYSSGMQMRLGFAVSAQVEPDILLLDEIFAVGDAEFQAKCLGTIQGLRTQGKTILFVSHSPEAVTTVCDRVCVLDDGELRFDGNVGEGLAFYDGLRQSAEPMVRPRR